MVLNAGVYRNSPDRSRSSSTCTGSVTQVTLPGGSLESIATSQQLATWVIHRGSFMAWQPRCRWQPSTVQAIANWLRHMSMACWPPTATVVHWRGRYGNSSTIPPWPDNWENRLDSTWHNITRSTKWFTVITRFTRDYPLARLSLVGTVETTWPDPFARDG